MNTNKFNIEKFLYKFFIVLIIFLGIFIRAKLYVTKGIFEDDECRLALAMFGKHLWQMFLPIGPFSSTPTFLFFSKIVANLTNYNEYALTALPFIASIAGIMYFYKLTEQYFQKKLSVIIANFLFAYNFQLISFSATFKQYSIEVLITIMCLYYFPKIDICKLSIKQNMIVAFILMIIPLISLPSLFLVSAFIIINIFLNLKEKLFYKKLILCIIPPIVLFTVYYIYNLAPTKVMQYANFAHFWGNIYSNGIISTFASFLDYVVYPNPIIICHEILIILFFVTVCHKTKRVQIDIYIIFFFIFFIVAHFLHLYPLHGRIALYAFPIIILMFVKTVDSINKNKIMLSVTSVIMLIGFLCYILPSYSVSIMKNTDKSFIKYSPKKMLQTVQKNFNPDTDIIVVNEASAYCFLFYNKKLNFNTDNYIGVEHDKQGRITRENDIRQLNNLDSKKHYWFYLVKEFIEAPERIYIQEWLEQQNIKYFAQEYTSFLYYIVPPYKKLKL